VDNLYLRIPWGKSFCLLGPSGAGKTSILQLLLGIKRVAQGEGICLGFDLVRQFVPIREKTSLVEEEPRLYDFLKVKEMIDFCRSLYPHWNHQLLWGALLEVGINEEIKVGSLSPAYQSLLALLLALAPQPELLLIDEPCRHYGYHNTHTWPFFARLIEEQLQDPQRTVLMVSRELGELESMVDQVGLLDQGKLRDTFTPEELLEKDD